MDFISIKPTFLAIVGALGAFVASFLGGWDIALQTLVIFMILDYLTGLIVAGVFHSSNKSESGTLDSKAGFKGLCRKGMMLAIILVAHQVDKVSGTELVRAAVVYAFMVNEAVSILENAGLMGLPIPDVLKRAIELLRKKEQPQGDVNNGI